MSDEPITPEDPAPEMSDISEPEPVNAGIRDIGTLLSAKRSIGATVDYRFDFENWDGSPARIDFKLKRPVFVQGFAFGAEEAEASATEATVKWRREGDRSKEPKDAYALGYYVAKELVSEPRPFRSEDFVMALPPAARMQLPRRLMAAVGLGPKFWMEMRGGSDVGEVLEALLRQSNSPAPSAAPLGNSATVSSPAKSGPSSSQSEPTGSETVETES